MAIVAFAWRPDGAGLLVSATDNFSTDLLTDRFFAVSRDGRQMMELARPGGPVSNLSVSPDNRFLVYIGSTGAGRFRTAFSCNLWTEVMRVT